MNTLFLPRNVGLTLFGKMAMAWGLVACHSLPQLQAAPPALVVVVSVDQWPYDYLTRFGSGLSAQGVTRRCQTSGIWYDNCLHQHAYTFTGPGHAVLLTGAYPSRHGIVDNDWYDRQTKARTYCVSDAKARIIGTTYEEKPASPANLLVDTVGDQMKLASNRQSKVFGVAIKDRAAILMAGHLADAAYWMSYDGSWITSDYYRSSLPGYLRNLNEQRNVFQHRGQTWERLLDPSRYVHGAKEVSLFERPRFGMGADFPHVLPNTADETYIRQLVCSPYGNDVTLEAAKLVLENEALGQDAFPDLLAINLSSPDYIGHSFGPHSLEVEDCTYRTDAQLGQFIDYLESRIPQGWVMFVTSDHGVAPIPELAASWKVPAVRNPLGKPQENGDLPLARAQLEAYLQPQLGYAKEGPPLVEFFTESDIYLKADHAAMQGPQGAVARQLVRDWLLRAPAVVVAATREELLQPAAGHDDMTANQLVQLMRRSYFAARNGDVQYIMRPYHLTSEAGTSHGTPWRYDRHIPLLVVSGGSLHLPQGRIAREVSPAAMAATIAGMLQVPQPAGCEESPLFTLP